MLHCDKAIRGALCFVILKVQGIARSRWVKRFNPFWFECCIAMLRIEFDRRVRREADQDIRNEGGAQQSRVAGGSVAFGPYAGWLRLDDR